MASMIRIATSPKAMGWTPPLLIETLQDVLPGIRSKIIVDEQTSGILPLLNLDAQKREGL